jgi:hypothetical protein
VTKYEITEAKNRTDQPVLSVHVDDMSVQVNFQRLMGRECYVYGLTQVTAFVGPSKSELRFSPSMFRVTEEITGWRRIDASPALWSDAGTLHDMLSFNQSLAKQREVLDKVITDALLSLYIDHGSEMAARMLLDMLSIDLRDPMQCLRYMAECVRKEG